MNHKVLTEEPKTQVLAVVPTSIYGDCSEESLSNRRNQSNNQIFLAEFNVAIWLKLTEPCKDPISIYLECTDSKGRREVFVDKGKLNSAKHLMLSAKVALRFRGYITSMKITCRNESHHTPKVYVDELYVQAVKKAISLSSTISRV